MVVNMSETDCRTSKTKNKFKKFMNQTSSNQKKKKEKRQIFSLRLSSSERLELENKAAEAGLKLSEYLRQTGLRRKIRSKVPEINREMYLELGRIGNNLNQLTKNCHIALQQGNEIRLFFLLVIYCVNGVDKTGQRIGSVCP